MKKIKIKKKLQQWVKMTKVVNMRAKTTKIKL